MRYFTTVCLWNASGGAKSTNWSNYFYSKIVFNFFDTLFSVPLEAAQVLQPTQWMFSSCSYYASSLVASHNKWPLVKELCGIAVGADVMRPQAKSRTEFTTLFLRLSVSDIFCKWGHIQQQMADLGRTSRLFNRFRAGSQGRQGIKRENRLRKGTT